MSDVASTPSSSAVSVQDQQVALAEALGIEDPPEVAPRALVAPEERDGLVRDCMSEQGWSVDAMAERGIPDAQLESFTLAEFVCLASYPVDPEFSGAWADAQIIAQYQWTVDSVVPCLQREGYAIEGVPTQDTFVGTWHSRPFFPFEQIPPGSVSNEQFLELEQQCPQIAPADVLWR